MTYSIKDHGTWSPYIPGVLPEWAQEVNSPMGAVAFLRRDSDGVDFYDHRKSEPFAADAILATTMLDATTGKEIVGSVFRDQSMSFPAGQRLLEIGGVPPEPEKPHDLFAGRIYDPVTKEIGDLWTQPVLSVTDYQFAGQANAEGIIDDQETDDWVATGVVPDKLVQAVKAQNLGTDRERRVLLFLRGTTVFPRFHELTPLLAASFGKDTPEKLDEFFRNAAAR